LAEQWLLRNTPRDTQRDSATVGGVSRLRLSETLAERAAIIEIDGGAPRPWAEWLAVLECTAPPDAVDAAGRFLDAWGQTAEALGWSPAELMTLLKDDLAVFARITVLAITDQALTVREAGQLRTIRRRGAAA
jgi:hypothetical protein